MSFSYYLFYFIFNKCNGHYCPLFRFDIRIILSASKKTKGIKTGGCLYAKGMGLGTSMSTHRSESVFNKYEFEYTMKTSFTLEVTLRKSRVEGGWNLASPYVVHPCLHAQWSHISGLV